MARLLLSLSFPFCRQFVAGGKGVTCTKFDYGACGEAALQSAGFGGDIRFALHSQNVDTINYSEVRRAVCFMNLRTLCVPLRHVSLSPFNNLSDVSKRLCTSRQQNNSQRCSAVSTCTVMSWHLLQEKGSLLLQYLE